MRRARKRPGPPALARLRAEPLEPARRIRRAAGADVRLDRVGDVVVEEQWPDARKNLRFVALGGVGVLRTAEREERERARADEAGPRDPSIRCRGGLLCTRLLLRTLRRRELGEDPHVSVDLRAEPTDLLGDPQALADFRARLCPASR